MPLSFVCGRDICIDAVIRGRAEVAIARHLRDVSYRFFPVKKFTIDLTRPFEPLATRECVSLSPCWSFLPRPLS